MRPRESLGDHLLPHVPARPRLTQGPGAGRWTEGSLLLLSELSVTGHSALGRAGSLVWLWWPLSLCSQM